ncbi:MAG: 2-C-methyl-D-erythritol 4-phosphate cytidylyltransferase [candidate division KSB1 bacterium]|nr:2-C-methyl-D-erythritol 4-phosphate cytidylyltransferase [candidate division KSB1 bacterium]MDZ7392483.1 2-C-methyl-D-erythritol 4-phosphate cytidylyltransferase [candidate division KSB1 bacterium]
MRAAVIVVAAGRSERFGTGTPKQFALLRGRPMVVHALMVFERMPRVEAVELVVPGGQEGFVREEVVQRYALRKVKAIVAGGQERQDSVWAGLQALPPEVELVAVHDGARPLVNARVVEAVLEAAELHGAAIPVLRLHDTIKEVQADQVVCTLARDRLVAVQTPQAFHRTLLLEAYRAARVQGIQATDDAALVERIGYPVWVVAGDPRTMKVTTPHDFFVVEQLLAREEGA